jgi:hypothetical protein
MHTFNITVKTLNIPIHIWIVWLEVNIFGKTILPELLCFSLFSGYLMWRIMWWKSMLEIRVLIQEKESI